MNNLLQLEKIIFDNDKRAVCIFPNDIHELEQGIDLMGIRDRPAIVLVGGHIMPEHDAIHKRVMEIIARSADDLGAVVISGGTDMGNMALMGHIRGRERYRFPLIGIAPESLVTWPGVPISSPVNPSSAEKVPLEPHHSHFILVPGDEFGDESSWIVRAATFIAGNLHQAVNVLANGGDVSKRDIELALAANRPVIVLKGTGRLADDIAHQPRRSSLIKIVRAEDKQTLVKSLHALVG